MKYKALIVDVDGTLVINRLDAMPTQKVTRAMNAASKLLHVGLATSRCYPNVSSIMDLLKLSGPSILEGGGHIFDAKRRKTISEYILSRRELKYLQKMLQTTDIPFLYCDSLHADHGSFPQSGALPEKVFMVFSQGTESHLAHNISRRLSEDSKLIIHTVPSWTTGKTDILITNPLATKQHGILEVAKILGIETHEIIGVGDGNNDMPLLMACGLKVAMGNAGDDLKAIADYIAPTVEEDGLADVINKFILN